MVRFFPAILVLVGACGARGPGSAPVAHEAPRGAGAHEDQVSRQVQPFLDAEIVTGMVIGLIDGDQIERYGFGHVRAGGAAPGSDTIFEIGSVTKVFTALLLGDAVARGEVSLDTPISKLVPYGVVVPSKDGVPIVLGHLVTHTSGLPTMPPSVVPKAASADPYAGYTVDQMYDELPGVPLAVRPGHGQQYSNLGYALLGAGLAREADTSWERLITERLLGPLGLRNTWPERPKGEDARLAQGHDTDLAPTPPWSLDAIAPAGAMYSTLDDMLAFVRANLDAAASGQGPLAALLRQGQAVIAEGEGSQRALAWFVDRAGHLWHSGGTGGAHAYVAIDPEHRRGVVILAATATSLVDRLGGALFDVLAGKPPDPVRFPDAAAVQALAGIYDLRGTPVTVAARGRRLYVNTPGEQPTRLSPLSDHEFYLELGQAVVIFEREGDHVTRLVLVAGGQRLVAPRSGTAPRAPRSGS